MDDDRRRNVRIDINVSMHLVVFDAGTTAVLPTKELIKLRKGIICDISLAGMYIETYDLKDSWILSMLSGGIQMALKFQLRPSDDPINISTKIMWVRKQEKDGKYSVGLRFMEISEADRVQIMQFIIKRKSENKKIQE